MKTNWLEDWQSVRTSRWDGCDPTGMSDGGD